MGRKKKVKWACKDETLTKLVKEIDQRPKTFGFKKLPKCPSFGKKSYTKEVAQRKSKKAKIHLRPYKCVMCPHWHLTKQKKGRKKKKSLLWLYKKMKVN